MPETVVRDAPARPQAPIDPNVRVPDAVRRAAAAAEAAIAAQHPQPDPPPVDPPPQPDPPPVDPPPQPDPPPVDPPPQPDPPVGDVADDNDASWRHRFLSMQGRWQQSQRTIGSLQEQLSEMGNELMQAHAIIAQNAGQTPAPAAPHTPRLLTPEDEAQYGPELLDVVTRAARQAIEPELQAVKNENITLQQQLKRDAVAKVNALLDTEVPNWRQINKAPEFKAWLSKRDVYSGNVRQSLLNDAAKAADAPRVLQFFKGFLDEVQATGNGAQPQPQPQPPASPAPRVAAVPLETLAAPGRPRPATGADAQAQPADTAKSFTRAEIRQFYADVRRGVYTGRDADKNRIEAEIFAAQNTGRVR